MPAVLEDLSMVALVVVVVTTVDVVVLVPQGRHEIEGNVEHYLRCQVPDNLDVRSIPVDSISV
jgi:hypothetical protein